jgi:hypothetical protein
VLAAVEERLRQAQAEGDLPDDLARYVMAVSNGIAVQAPAAARSEKLQRAVDIARQAWPTSR